MAPDDASFDDAGDDTGDDTGFPHAFVTPIDEDTIAASYRMSHRRVGDTRRTAPRAGYKWRIGAALVVGGVAG